MIEFGVIGFLILVLVFVVTRNQGIQRDFKQLQYAHKALQSQNKYSLAITTSISTQLQHAFQSKLTSLHKSALINNQDHQLASFIIENFKYVIMQCCQHNETIEVAVNKALKGQELTIEQVSQFIASQPSEVRMAWSRNNIEGYMAACRMLVTGTAKVEQKADEQFEHKA